MTLGVVADDLTGACDAAGRFASAGLRTEVRLGIERAVDGLDVLLVDANVRDMAGVGPEERWLPLFGAAVEAIARGPASLGMLKIDSTLRGPIGRMVAELLKRSDLQGAIFAPAFPRQGRFLIDGRLALGSPLAPLTTDACELLREAGLSVGRVSSSIASVSPRSLEEAVLLHLERKTQVIVVDTDCEACCENAAAVWHKHRRHLLLVGSAGLAQPLGSLLVADAAHRRAGQPDFYDGCNRSIAVSAISALASPPRQRQRIEAGILVVAGSPSSSTATQIKNLSDTRGCGIVEVGPDLDADGIGTLCATSGDLLCLRPASPERDSESNAEVVRDTGEAAARLAQTVGGLVDHWRPGGLVLVGGATSRAVIDELGVCAIEIGGEVEPGIPIGTLRGGSWPGLAVITKAGAFGDPGVLTRAVDRLRKEDR